MHHRIHNKGGIQTASAGVDQFPESARKSDHKRRRKTLYPQMISNENNSKTTPPSSTMLKGGEREVKQSSNK